MQATASRDYRRAQARIIHKVDKMLFEFSVDEG